MQSEKEQTETRRGGNFDGAETGECPSCHALMVRGMRFCRQCGYRLGEGVAEYAETRLFTGAAPTGHAAASNTAMPGQWGAGAPMMNTSSLDPTRQSSMWRVPGVCSRMRMSWVMWLVIAISILAATGVITRGVRRWGGNRGGVVATAPKSFLGVDGFETADGGGAFIEGIAGPDTPVERAGLLGGDVITSLDGKPVEDEEAMSEILAATPAGKTVEVIYTRDGEAGRRTMLTTGSRKDYQGMRALDVRPGGKGRIGVDDLDRVRVPNSNIYGVRLGEVERNLPADIAGLKDGDVVTDFNNHPVRTVGDLRLRIYEAIPGSVVDVVVVRSGGGERLVIPVKIGRSKD